MDAAYHSTLFPKCFSEAHGKLRSKFKQLDNETIRDSIQYAYAEYWIRRIDLRIQDENQAFGWFISTAYHYLYKEIKRLSRSCTISEAMVIPSTVDIEQQIIYREELMSLEQSVSRKWSPTLIRHAMGYSLKELAETENISLSSVQQRHARERMLAKKILKRNTQRNEDGIRS